MRNGIYANQEMFSRQAFALCIVLVLGFFIPNYLVPSPSVSNSTNWKYINFNLLWEEGVSSFEWLMIIYPLIAGIIILVVSLLLRNIIRSIAILITGFVPLIMIVLLCCYTNQELNVYDFTGVSGIGTIPGFFIYCVGFIGWTALLAGSRVLQIKPDNKNALFIAAVGGTVYLTYFVISLFFCEQYFVGTILPHDSIKILIEVISFISTGVDMFANSIASIGGTILLIICYLSASVFCIGAFVKKSLFRTHVKYIFPLLMCGIIFSHLPALVYALIVSRDIAVFISIMKFALWFYGLALLLPAGVSDLIVQFIPTTQEKPASIIDIKQI